LLNTSVVAASEVGLSPSRCRTQLRDPDVGVVVRGAGSCEARVQRADDGPLHEAGESIDVSETMLRRAAGDTERAGLSREVGYVRGDAEALPFVDGSFDAVCCFAALNLFADPWRALDSATAVLRPGGRIAIFTSVRGRSPLLRAGEAVLQAQSGMTMFERHEVVDALHARGFGEVRQRLTGVTQFVGGRLEG